MGCVRNQDSGGPDRRRTWKDVRVVEVTLSRWVTHSDNFEGTPSQAAIPDQAMDAPI